jgi:hypothetical protein
MSNCLQRQQQNEDQIWKDEHEEVLVVAVAETVVDEWTVVVEVFDATSAKHAVEWRLCFYHFVVGAEVHKVKIFVQEFLSQGDEVELFLKESRVDWSANYIGWD